MGEKRTRREFLAVSTVVGTTVVAGCSGGGGDGGDDENEGDTEEPTATPVDTATPEEDTPTPDEEESTPDDEDQPARPSVDPWPMARYDAHNTGRNAGTTGPQGEPVIDWEADLDGTPITVPVVGNNAVYVGTTSDRLYALSPVDGSTLWSVDLGGQPSTPAVGAGTVYVPNAGITAYDAVSGQRQWHFAGRGARGLAPALYEDGVVYAGVQSPDGVNDVYAVRADGGKQWTHRDLTVGSGSAVPTALASDGGDLYIATTAPSVPVLGKRRGARKRSVEVGPTPGIAIDDEILAFGGSGAGIWGRSAEEVRGRLTDTVDSVRTASAPLLVDDTVIYGTVTGVNADRTGVMAIGRENAFVNWSVGDAVEMRLPATASEGMVYAPGETELYAITDFGADEWTMSFDNQILTPPTVSSGRLFLGLGGSRVVSLAEA